MLLVRLMEQFWALIALNGHLIADILDEIFTIKKLSWEWIIIKVRHTGFQLHVFPFLSPHFLFTPISFSSAPSICSSSLLPLPLHLFSSHPIPSLTVHLSFSLPLPVKVWLITAGSDVEQGASLTCRLPSKARSLERHSQPLQGHNRTNVGACTQTNLIMRSNAQGGKQEPNKMHTCNLIQTYKHAEIGGGRQAQYQTQ